MATSTIPVAGSPAATETGGTGARKRGRPRNEQAEAAILDAAIGLLAEHGYAGLTVEAVAARAGVAKTTVYRRWPGKDELLVDAVTTVKGPIAKPPGGSVAGDLKWLMERMRQSWTSGNHGKMMRRLSAEGADQPELYRMFCDRVVAPRRAVTRSILQRGVDEGIIRAEVDLDDVIDMLSAPTIVAVMTLKERITAAQVEFVVDTVLTGIAPQTS
jgi:AcrR family transcriptional regulator